MPDYPHPKTPSPQFIQKCRVSRYLVDGDDTGSAHDGCVVSGVERVLKIRNVDVGDGVGSRLVGVAV